jgi:Na+-transporting NADH:ubiquinone oxidoreductase subunit C
VKRSQTFFARRLKPLIFMAVATIICIVLTSSLHLLTRERVELNELFFMRRSILDAAAVEHTGDVEGVNAIYESMVSETGEVYVVTTDEGNNYVKVFKGPGLWGEITILVGFEDDLKTISGVSVFAQNETPGLGARIEEPWFSQQFKGKAGPFSLVEEGTATASDEMDAITGATRTSDAFKNIINRAISESATLKGGQ